MDYREARKADLDAILQLYTQLNTNETPVSLERAMEIWGRIETDTRIKYFVATDGDKIVSSCNIIIVPNLTRNGRPFAVIENVVTDASCRRKGIARKVMNMALDFARQNNCYKAQLLSGIKRSEAHKFYESMGFDGNSKKGFDMRLDL